MFFNSYSAFKIRSWTVKISMTRREVQIAPVFLLDISLAVACQTMQKYTRYRDEGMTFQKHIPLSWNITHSLKYLCFSLPQEKIENACCDAPRPRFRLQTRKEIKNWREKGERKRQPLVEVNHVATYKLMMLLSRSYYSIIIMTIVFLVEVQTDIFHCFSYLILYLLFDMHSLKFIHVSSKRWRGIA